MSKAVFLFNSLSDRAFVSGGDWLNGDTALSNIQNDRYWRVARSTSLLPEDTQFDIDCRSSKTAAGFAIILPNAAPTCRVRVSAYSDAGFSNVVFQTGWLVGSDDAEWKDDERAPIISSVFLQAVTARYWRVEIEDLDNLYGYVDVARFFLAEGLSPSFNYGYGASLTFKNNSLSSSTLAGGTVYWRRVNPRQWQCAFNYLPDDEAFGKVYDFLRFVGFDREVFIIPEPGDVAHAQARSFFGTITQLDPLSQVVVGRSSFGFGVEEIVALIAIKSGQTTVPVNRLVIRDFAPHVEVAIWIIVPGDDLVQADFAPSISLATIIDVPSDALEQVDYAVSVGTGVALALPVDLLSVDDYPPTVSIGSKVTLPADALLADEYAPEIITGAIVDVPEDETVIRDFVPQFGSGVFIDITVADALKIRGYAPSVATSAILTLPSDDLEISDFVIGALKGFNAGFDSGFH